MAGIGTSATTIATAKPSGAADGDERDTVATFVVCTLALLQFFANAENGDAYIRQSWHLTDAARGDGRRR